MIERSSPAASGFRTVEWLVIATVTLALALGVLTTAHIFVVALLSATVFVFSDPAVFGAVPALVPPERLPSANGTAWLPA